MSARQPFVPSRPASRATHIAASENHSNSVPRSALQSYPQNDASSSAVVLNPSQGTSQEQNNNIFSQVSQQSTTRAIVDAPEGASMSALLTSINKPLNISGLMQKKRNQSTGSHAQLLSKSRKTDPNDSPPLSPSPWSTNHLGSRIATPAPRLAGRPASPFLPNPGFRAPALPSSKLGSASFHSHAFVESSVIDVDSNDTHTPTETCALNAGRTGADTEHSLLSFSMSPPHSNATSNLNSSLEKRLKSSHPPLDRIQEAAEDDVDRRLDIYEPRPFEDNDDSPVAMSSDNRSHTLRKTNKRVTREDESDEDYGFGVEAKRWKGSQVVQGRQTEFVASKSRHSTPAPQNHYHLEGPEEDDGRMPANRARQTYPRDEGQLEQRGQEQGGGHALQQLLGRDLDSFMESHIQTYEKAKQRWTECSMEEWQAGAGELMDKFGSVMDFVKAHMMTKMSLYTSLHLKVAEHKGILGEREKVLKDVREGLVRESGNVLGRGIGT